MIGNRILLKRAAVWLIHDFARGDDTIKLYDWMEELREQALQQGGNVLSHVGNHEWMNVIGTSHCYLHRGYISELLVAPQAIGDMSRKLRSRPLDLRRPARKRS